MKQKRNIWKYMVFEKIPPLTDSEVRTQLNTLLSTFEIKVTKSTSARELVDAIVNKAGNYWKLDIEKQYVLAKVLQVLAKQNYKSTLESTSLSSPKKKPLKLKLREEEITKLRSEHEITIRRKLDEEELSIEIKKDKHHVFVSAFVADNEIARCNWRRVHRMSDNFSQFHREMLDTKYAQAGCMTALLCLGEEVLQLFNSQTTEFLAGSSALEKSSATLRQAASFGTALPRITAHLQFILSEFLRGWDKQDDDRTLFPQNESIDFLFIEDGPKNSLYR